MYRVKMYVKIHLFEDRCNKRCLAAWLGCYVIASTNSETLTTDMAARI